MKRKLVASLLFVCAVILFAASCGRPHSSETSGDTTNKGPSPPVEIKKETTKKGPSPPVEIKDPIISMVLASSIDDKGTLVNPRFSFPQTDKQITAVVQLGKIKGSQLTVTWYKTSDDGDAKLFEHQVPVNSHERAFSVAKNQGMFMSAGTYKVVATLDGQTKDVEFDIIPPKPEPKKTTDNRAARHFAGLTELEHDRADSAETSSDGLLQPISHEPILDQSDVRKVASNQSSPSGSSSPSASMFDPLFPGASGTVTSPHDRFRLEGGENQECWFIVAGDKVDAEADDVEIISGGFCTMCCDTVAVYATVDGPPREVGRYDLQGTTAGQAIPDSNHFRVDPCWLPGGSDLPDTTVTLKAKITTEAEFQAWWTTKLGDDTLAPRVHVVSTPARHSKVKEGDKISLKVDATELRNGGPWQTGVKMVQVTALPGGQVGEPWVNSASPLSQKCEQKTWEHKYEATYIVPSNPPPIIKICALAEDYVGNPASNCGDFVTGDWYGTLREHDQGNLYNDTVEVNFSFNEERNGTIKGAGRVAEMTSEPQLFGGHTITRTLHIKPDEAAFPISGKRVGDEFQLELQVPKGPTIRVDIKSDKGTGEGARTVFVSEPSHHPKVKAQDGATNSFHTNLGGNYQVDATIEIHRAKQ